MRCSTLSKFASSGRGLVDSMAEMRTWLDHQRIEPHGFVTAAIAPASLFHVDFNSEPDAIGFARAFGGRMVRRAGSRLERDCRVTPL